MEATTHTITFLMFLLISTSVLTSAKGDSSKKYPLVEISCTNQKPDDVQKISIGVVFEGKSEKLAWILNDNINVNYHNLIHAVPHASGMTSQRPAYLSILLTDFNPEVNATFNCSITTSDKDGESHIHSEVIKPSFSDVKTTDNERVYEDKTTPLPVPVIILAVLLAVISITLLLLIIKFLCLDKGRCRRLSMQVPVYYYATPHPRDEVNNSPGNQIELSANNDSVAKNISEYAKFTKGRSCTLHGSTRSLGKSYLPYRAYNGSTVSVSSRMPQPPPPPPVPKDGPPDKPFNHRHDVLLKSNAQPHDAINLGPPAMEEEDDEDQSSELYQELEDKPPTNP